MTCTKGQDLCRCIVEYHERLSGDKIVVDVNLEGGQYVPARISTLAGRPRVKKGTDGVRHAPILEPADSNR